MSAPKPVEPIEVAARRVAALAPQLTPERAAKIAALLRSADPQKARAA